MSEPTTDAGLRLSEDGRRQVMGALEALRAVVNRWVSGAPVQPDDVITVRQVHALLSRALVDRDGMSVDEAERLTNRGATSRATWCRYTADSLEAEGHDALADEKRVFGAKLERAAALLRAVRGTDGD